MFPNLSDRPIRSELSIMQPIVSIIVVNHNGGRLLADCIQAVRKCTQQYELVLIDNHSTDGSLDLVEKKADLRIMRVSRNVGFATANNIGIRSTTAPYVVLLNPDTVVTSRWLDKLTEIAERSNTIGVVAPKLLRWSNPSTLDSTGHIFQYETGAVTDRGFGEVDRGQYDNSTELSSCSFACALIKRGVFESIGLLDEAMFLYFEDVDFGLRARNAGWRIVYCPHSVVYHLHWGSTPANQRKHAEEQSLPYGLRVMLKNYENLCMIRYGGQRILLDLLRIVAGCKNFDLHYAKRYARDILWNVVHFPLKERMVGRGLSRARACTLS